MNNNYLTLIIAVLSSSVITAAVTAIITAIVNRRKYDIENEDRLSQMAMSLANEFEQKYKEVKEENRLLVLRVETLEKENAQYRSSSQITVKDTKNASLRGLS